MRIECKKRTFYVRCSEIACFIANAQKDLVPNSE